MNPARTPSVRRYRGDDGVVAFELVVSTTIVLGLFVPFLLFVGRITQGDRVVSTAAQEAARAATLRTSRPAAEAEAHRIVDANLAAAGVACAHALSVAVDTTELRPGGQVTVTVTCDAAMADLMVLGVPGTRRFTSVSTQIVDRFRSDP